MSTVDEGEIDCHVALADIRHFTNAANSLEFLGRSEDFGNPIFKLLDSEDLLRLDFVLTVGSFP